MSNRIKGKQILLQSSEPQLLAETFTNEYPNVLYHNGIFYRYVNNYGYEPYDDEVLERDVKRLLLRIRIVQEPDKDGEAGPPRPIFVKKDIVDETIYMLRTEVLYHGEKP